MRQADAPPGHIDRNLVPRILTHQRSTKLNFHRSDVFCLGIKDVMFESVDSEFFAMYMDATDAGSPMVSVDPGYARKLLRDLAAWSQSIGFAPHRDFAAVERMFGDVSADASEAVFRFGHDGKPVYIPGPTDTGPLIQRRIAQLRKVLGDDGFETAA